MVVLFVFTFYKPIYSFIFLLVFLPEHAFFLTNCFRIYNGKKSNYYSRIYVDCSRRDNISIYELLIKINEIDSFKRTYVLCLNNKIKVKDFVLTFVIIILGIPLKTIKILYTFINKRQSVRDTLIEVFEDKAMVIKNRKIEIINGCIYINCSSKLDILLMLKYINNKASNVDIAKMYKGLVGVNERMVKTRALFTNTVYPFHLGNLTTEEGYKIKKPHWSRESEFIIKGESVRLVTHATSNIPNEIRPSQVKSVGIRELILSGSKNPGTLITSGGFKFQPIRKDVKIVSAWEVHNIMYNVYGTDAESMYNTAYDDIENEILEKLNINKMELKDKLITKDFVSDIMGGRHSIILSNDSSTTLEEVLNYMNEACVFK